MNEELRRRCTCEPKSILIEERIGIRTLHEENTKICEVLGFKDSDEFMEWAKVIDSDDLRFVVEKAQEALRAETALKNAGQPRERDWIVTLRIVVKATTEKDARLLSMLNKVERATIMNVVEAEQV